MNRKYILPVLSFTGGETQTLELKLHNKYNIAVNADYLTCTFTIANYSARFSTPVLVRSGTIIVPDGQDENSYFRVILEENDTLNLFGKYVYQIDLRDQDEHIELYQGILNIYENIN